MYAIKFSYAGQYPNLIFNNGSSQTVDISLYDYSGNCFKLDSTTNGKYNVSNYTIDLSGETPEDPPVITGHDYALLYYVSGEHNWTDTSKLFTPDGQGLWTAASTIGSSPKASFNTLLNYGYGAGIAYSETQNLSYTIKFNGNGATSGGLVLPIITLSLYPMAYITRLTRSSMLDVLGQDYIRTARAKGVSKWKIIFGHAMKNSLIPVITYFGPMIAYIVTGSIVVEQIFAVPGIGRAFVQCIINRDYPMIMGTTIILAILIVVMNMVSDILYKVVDPRIKFD